MSLYSETEGTSVDDPAGSGPAMCEAEEDSNPEDELICSPDDAMSLGDGSGGGDTSSAGGADTSGSSDQTSVGSDTDVCLPPEEQVCEAEETPAVEEESDIVREICTVFGDYTIYKDTFVGPLNGNNVTQARFTQIEKAWTQLNANTGGLTMTGSKADIATFIGQIAEGMNNSRTFRDRIVTYVEDTSHPIVCNVGRDNAAWVDSFANNNVDLNDLEWFERDPPAKYPWVMTQGEIILHFLEERHYHAVHGGGFANAHAHPNSEGGVQEGYRQDRGQEGRIVSQTGVQVPGSPGDVDGVFTDSNGNQMSQRIPSFGNTNSDATQMTYTPATPTADAPVTTTNTAPSR